MKKSVVLLFLERIFLKIRIKDIIDIGEWKFIPKKGFFPIYNDPLLAKDVIKEEDVEKVLDKYKEKFSKWIDGTNIDLFEHQVQFNLFFDNDKNLHICIYVFEKNDLEEDGGKLFGKWGYLPGKGFYHLKGLLFSGIKRVIKPSLLSEFIDRYKSFLSQYEGFNIHLTNIESSIRYTFKEGVLEILGDELHDEETGVIDFGKYLYVKGQGFYVQGAGRLDKHIFPGMRVQKEELSHFISANKEELETVTNFFVQDEGLDKTGLMVTYVEEMGISIEPKYYFSEQIMKYDPKVYGDYIYLKDKGFLEISPSLRLPEKYQKKVVIEKDRMPFFLKHELNKIKPYVIHMDTASC